MEILQNLISRLSNSFGDTLPRILGVILIIIIGFFVAKLVKKLVKSLMGKTNIDEKLGSQLNTSVRIDEFVSKLAYYLIILYALIIALDMLGVKSVLLPLQDMLSQFVGYIPKVIGAGVIGFAGYMIGTIGAEATGFVSERLERFGSKVGLNTGSLSLTKIVKQVVFIILFIPLLILALDTLEMAAISEPATEMLRSLFTAVPKIIAAVILLAIFFVIGKYVVSIVTELLRNLGVDDMAHNLGLGNVIGDNSFSKLIGNIALFFIMFTGIIAATDKLELGHVNTILSDVFNISGKVFFGLLILLVGVFISNLAVKAISNSSSNGIMVPIVRFATLGIFLAFGLHTMGIAESIVNLAFGLTLGAVAVAFALSFGLGGRDAAVKQMESFFKSIKKSKQ